MKKSIFLFMIFLPLLGTGCRFNIDLLGRPTLEEVTLLKSAAREKILVIDVDGMIMSSGPDGIFNREGDVLSRVYARLQRAAEDRLVRGVILRLDTPGGDVTSSDILYHEIIEFKKKTGLPVVALMMGVAASGGYYAASACDAIVAHPSTLTGSIGVISVFPNVSSLLAKVGLEMKIIKSGDLKDAGSPFREMSPEERQVFQTVIDEFYQDFLDAVYERRKDRLSMDELRALADGRIYTAEQALKLRLIDEIGYFDRALARVLSLASLRAARVVAYTYYPARKTNFYAAATTGPSLWQKTRLEDVLPGLRAGFYYLWLPEIERP